MQELDVSPSQGGDEVLANVFAELMVLQCLRGWPGAVQLVDFGRTSDNRVGCSREGGGRSRLGCTGKGWSVAARCCVCKSPCAGAVG